MSAPPREPTDRPDPSGGLDPRLDTLAVHAGEGAIEGSVVTPIFLTSTFDYPDGDRELRYTRYANNPSQLSVQAKLAALEGTEDALVLASGMAALSHGILASCGAGDRIVAAPSLYGGTHVLLDVELPRLGIETAYAESFEVAAFEAATTPATKVWLWESISNPLLRVADGPALAAAAKARGVATLVDATFASPINQRPASFGADLVMHSATKYLGGHSDLIGGVLAGSAAAVEAARARVRALGGSADPHMAFLLERGVKTLALRVARQNENGRAVAAFLAGHPKVERAHHPSLPDHPDRAVADRVLAGGGGVVTFVPRASAEEALAIAGGLRWIRMAPTLGGVDSMVLLPALTSHRHMTSEWRAARGFPDPTIRLALGIEASEDLIADLERALDGP